MAVIFSLLRRHRIGIHGDLRRIRSCPADLALTGHTCFVHCLIRDLGWAGEGVPLVVNWLITVPTNEPHPRACTSKLAPPTNPLEKEDKTSKMGLDVDRFEGDVEQRFICPYCAKVLENPVAGPCGHNFCAACVKKALSKRCTDCPVCDRDMETSGAKEASEELVQQLEKLSIHCVHKKSGCKSVVPYGKLVEHTTRDCEFRLTSCTHKGCTVQVPMNELDSHLETCGYRLVECKVCKVCVPRNDMPAHQALKRCYEQLNKRRMVTSARRLSQELRVHREEMVHQRHLTEQAERRLVQDHYSRDNPRHQRAKSAGPVLMRSISARVGSAIVVPHYSRNLRSAALESCRECTNRFTAGRRPSARRHSHAKPVRGGVIN